MKERLTTYHCGKAVIKDKNKLSEAMEKLAEFEEKEKCGEWLDAIELAKIAIALQSQKWIPVTERLPKDEKMVFGKPGKNCGNTGNTDEHCELSSISRWRPLE